MVRLFAAAPAPVAVDDWSNGVGDNLDRIGMVALGPTNHRLVSIYRQPGMRFVVPEGTRLVNRERNLASPLPASMPSIEAPLILHQRPFWRSAKSFRRYCFGFIGFADCAFPNL